MLRGIAKSCAYRKECCIISSMAAKKIACNSCGANLELESGSQYIRCSYCGANNLVNRNRAVAPPPVQVPAQAQITYNPKPLGLRNWAPYILLITAAGGLMYYSMRLQDRASSLMDGSVKSSRAVE